jgi:ParB family chromosome partitioning protein
MSSQGGIKQLATGRSDVYRLAPNDIHVKDGWNVREFNDPENSEHIEMLAASISQVGIRTPLRVYWQDGKAFVSDGHCRLAAVKLAMERGADIKNIPVITEDRHSNDADHVLTMLVGNSGKSLTSIESARVLKRLVDFGWSVSEIAAKTDRSTSWVSQLLELNAAPQPVLDMIAQHLVSASQASAVVRAQGGEKATTTLTAAVERAKSTGKKKATARDIGDAATGMTFKAEIRAIFARSKPDPKTDSWFFNHNDFTRLQELL